MKLLADEGVDRPIVDRLRQAGHDVLYVAEMDPNVSDDQVLVLANDHEALLVTADKDFGELVFRLRRIHGGVVLLRLAGLAPTTKAQLVSDAIEKHSIAMLDAFTVISAGMVRIRHRA